jgi:chloramphenicol-sensitive protein RarD
MPTSSKDPAAASRGALAAALSFLLWGVMPLYWKQMQSVSAFELIAQRVVWALAFMLVVLAWQKSLVSLRPAFTQARTFVSALSSGAVLAINWTIYVWAVNSGHIIDSSMGYFLSPLCNVALGFVFLHERLRRTQWIAIAFAVGGVSVLLFYAGHLPWIALSLASSWSLYGMFKKQSGLGSIAGLAVETLLLFPIAAAVLSWRIHGGVSAFNQSDARVIGFVLCSGFVTSIPLVLFAYGARRLRLATLGLLQYIAPSVQFLIGLLVYREPFDAARLYACMLIWCGLAIYTADSFWTQRRKFWPAADAA